MITPIEPVSPEQVERALRDLAPEERGCVARYVEALRLERQSDAQLRSAQETMQLADDAHQKASIALAQASAKLSELIAKHASSGSQP